MLARSRAPLFVLLAVTLSLSPALSWYAYADQSTEVQEVATDGPRGDEDDRGIGTSDEPGEVGAQSEDDCEVGEGAAEKQAETPSSPEDSSSVASGFLGAASDVLEQTSHSVVDSLASAPVSPADLSIMPYAGGFGGNLTEGFGGAFSGGSGSGKTANITDLVDAITAQWGWNYGKTAVLYSNSPAGWLKAIMGNTSNLSSVPSMYSLLQKQWGYGYGGTAVIQSNSPAYWLQWLYKYSWVTHTLPGDSSLRTVGFSELLYRVLSGTYDYVNDQTLGNTVGYMFADLRKQWGYGYGGTVVIHKGSPMDLLGKIQKNSDYITSIDFWSESINDLVGKIQRNSDYITSIDSRFQLLRTSLDNQFKSVFNRMQVTMTVPGEDSPRLLTSANLLYLILRQLYNFAKAWESWSAKGLSVDTSYIDAKLATIVDLMMAGAARDIVETLVGDLDFSRLGALSSEVSSAISNAFPFCIPAVLKQVLGLVRCDAAAPVWDFEVGGEPMRVDLAPMRPVADVSGWFCRVLFVVVLFANTRRFIFMGGGAASE